MFVYGSLCIQGAVGIPGGQGVTGARGPRVSARENASWILNYQTCVVLLCKLV